MQGDKWHRIGRLQDDLKRVEEEYCYAVREGDAEQANLLYLERGEVFHALKTVK